jgi:hypothetical protein
MSDVTLPLRSPANSYPVRCRGAKHEMKDAAWKRVPGDHERHNLSDGESILANYLVASRWTVDCVEPAACVVRSPCSPNINFWGCVVLGIESRSALFRQLKSFYKTVTAQQHWKDC